MTGLGESGGISAAPDFRTDALEGLVFGVVAAVAAADEDDDETAPDFGVTGIGIGFGDFADLDDFVDGSGFDTDPTDLDLARDALRALEGVFFTSRETLRPWPVFSGAIFFFRGRPRLLERTDDPLAAAAAASLETAVAPLVFRPRVCSPLSDRAELLERPRTTGLLLDPAIPSFSRSLLKCSIILSQALLLKTAPSFLFSILVEFESLKQRIHFGREIESTDRA